MTKQEVQYINKVHAMFNDHGAKIKKNSFASKVGFERAVKSREWSKVERATLEAMVIQLEAIHKSPKVLDAKIVALAETLPGYKNLISIKGIGMLSAAINGGLQSEFEDCAKSAFNVGRIDAFLLCRRHKNSGFSFFFAF